MKRTRSRLPEIHGTLIFEATWAGTIAQKATTLGVSAAFWAIWLTMWLPLFTLFMWFAAPIYGVDQALPAWQDAAMTLGVIVGVGVAMGAFLGLWGALQTIIGQNTPRARRPLDIQLDELAQWHQVEEALLKQAWGSRRLVLHHDSDGQVTDIEATHPGYPTLMDEVTVETPEGVPRRVVAPPAVPAPTEPRDYRDHVVVNGVLVWEPPAVCSPA